MDINEILVLLSMSILLVLNLVFYSKCKKKFSSFLFGSISGVVLLYPLSIILGSIGYSLTTNIFTIATSVILGIPGVILVSLITIF